MVREENRCKDCGLFIPLDNTEYYDGFCGGAHISFLYNKVFYIKYANKQSCGYFQFPLEINFAQKEKR